MPKRYWMHLHNLAAQKDFFLSPETDVVNQVANEGWIASIAVQGKVYKSGIRNKRIEALNEASKFALEALGVNTEHLP
ncbi:hypothetical protein FRB99_007607 [Tulasnella sp. 403]|nr:hypothetical protein FRB99_007607 [Tulasnella sp. 403]